MQQLFVFLLLFFLGSIVGQVTYSTTLFTSNSNDFQCYRTPAIVRAPNKDLLVFVEARKGAKNATECAIGAPTKSISMRKSSDNGRNWGPVRVLFDCKCGPGNECGYPSVVVDTITSTTWLMYSGGEGTLVSSSADNGNSWSNPKVLAVNSFAKNPSVGHGIQLNPLCGQQNAGRLLLPWVCGAHSLVESPYHSCIVYSDDHGLTWHLGASGQAGSRESEIAQVSNCKSGQGQSLYVSERNYQGPSPLGHRLYAWSFDSGLNFTEEGLDRQLVEPVTKEWTGVVASVITFVGKKEYLLFSDPDNPSSRSNVTIRISSDFAKTWTRGIIVDAGLSSYTDMVQLDQNTVGMTLEKGTTTPYDTIGYSIVDIQSIL